MKKIALVAVLAMLSGPALAQSVGEKTGVNSALGIAPKTSDFVTEAAMTDMFEIQSSELANTKAQGKVKAFANHMISDHSKTSNTLKGLAQAANITAPAALDSSHQSMLDKLNGLNGDDFTKQYVDDQVSGHKSAVSLYQRYAKGGDNDKIKAFAKTTLPTIQHHLDMAQSLTK
jgi:putative membrane protein